MGYLPSPSLQECTRSPGTDPAPVPGAVSVPSGSSSEDDDVSRSSSSDAE